MIQRIKLWIISFLGLGDLIAMLANEIVFEDRKVYIKYLEAQNTLSEAICGEAIKASANKTTREEAVKACRGLWRSLARNMRMTDKLIVKIKNSVPKGE